MTARTARRSRIGSLTGDRPPARLIYYTLDERGEFGTDISATTDRPTVVNIVNRAYWNLSRGAERTVLRNLTGGPDLVARRACPPRP